jgi:ferric-dicitrate binding protein FerR (iron transport regulator)
VDKAIEHIDYINLIGKYLSFQASSEEITRLENWVQSSAENQSIYQSYRKTLQLTHVQHIQTKVNLESEWNQFLSSTQKTIDINSAPANKKTKPVWLSIAASILILFSLSLTFYYYQNSSVTEQTKQNTLALVLEDKSEIILNHNSSVEYQKDYNETERRIELKGNAFFEVSPNKQKPCIVNTEDIEVKVLGTAFYIDTKSDDKQIEVFVKHGKVSVSIANGSSVILTSGKKAIYSKDLKTLVEQENFDPNFDAWNTKTLLFEETILENVIKTINKTYHTNLIIEDNRLKQIPLTASYQNKSLNAVLKILSESLDIVYIEKEGSIYVESKN